MIRYSHASFLLLPMFFATTVLTGCGENAHRFPKRQAVQDTVAAAMPSFLSLGDVVLEPISVGTERAKINFKAAATPKEDLYKVERSVLGTPKVTLLRLTQRKDTKLSLYGYVLAHRTLDKWTLAAPVIETGLDQLGNPRGAFGPESYVTDSNEASTALELQKKNADMQEQERINTLERQERERTAQAVSKTREEQALRELQKQANLVKETEQKEANLARESEQQAAAARRKIEEEKKEREALQQAEKRHVEEMERQARMAAGTVQQWLQQDGPNSKWLKDARVSATETKKLAAEARKEYEAKWGKDAQ